MSSFAVWAPASRTVEIVIGPGDEPRPMTAGVGGWWQLDVPDAPADADYAFQLDGSSEELPDPRSAHQPAGVHGRSRLVDHEAFAWTDQAWRGVPLAGSVLYELHVGTFTAEGTFDAAAERLDHLVDLGVDAVELLPCNAFPGESGWGYDGVDLFAVHEPYGGPAGLKRFVDAAHARAIGVIMDVVYNHLGPSGNYLSRFGPYFTDSHQTPWGPAVNLDAAGSDEVRAFLIDNALMWLRDYHCDGLRLDAVHALVDQRATHLLEELSGAVSALGTQLGKPLFLIAESDQNDPKLLRPVAQGGYGLTAQWTDDVHHALHATLTGERQGYYVDFGSLPTLAKALTRAFVHDGSWSSFRCRSHGRSADGVGGQSFVAYLQDHDQIGNRAQGDRIAATLTAGQLRVGAALIFTSPYVPMLFMGEEWGAKTPWQFFTDHSEPDLSAAVRDGRRSEFADHGWSADDIPDPQDPATARRSILDWNERDDPEAASLLDWHRQLISLRREEPALTGPRELTGCRYDPAGGWFVTIRASERGTGRIAVVCNLSENRQTVPVDGTPYQLLLASAPGFTFADGKVELDGHSVAVARLLD
jgi:maltooligosyltrehalose trehalohydrolase